MRQGCPVSALLFILVVEVLAINLKGSQYKGIAIESSYHSVDLKLSQYADDTYLFLKDEKQISTICQIVQKFSDLAGPKLNKSKTEGLCLGKENYRQKECTLARSKLANKTYPLPWYIFGRK